MKLPYMQNTKSKNKEYVLGFLGLNFGEGARVGEFSDMKNLSCAAYPCLSPRQPRFAFATLAAPTAFYARGQMCYVDGTSFYYYNEATQAFESKGTVIAGEKQFANVNTKIVIWPDKLMYDTVAGTMLPLGISLTRPVTFAQVTVPASTTVTTTGDAYTFNKGDAVKISGCTSVTANNDITAIIREISADKKTLTFDPLVFTAGTESAAVISREIPDMDYICDSNNRLWGCGGGKIYASALGQPENFNVLDGLSTDSFAVAVGSDGEFTGCISYGSMQVLFFKEHIVHELIGTKPANYDMNDGHYQGIMAGCHKSAVVINEILYYMSRSGVVSFAGSVPVVVSDAFGERKFQAAVAGTDGNSYYVSMQDEGGNWGLYIYDTKKRLWMKEDGTHAYNIALFEGSIYFLSSDGKIYKCGDGLEDFEWSGELCAFDETTTETKGYSRFTIRAQLEAGSYLNVEFSPDGKPWKLVKTVRAEGRRVFAVPILPTRCDSLRIRLSGKGECKIYAITREFSTGSDKP